jgi:hypothetical protein
MKSKIIKKNLRKDFAKYGDIDHILMCYWIIKKNKDSEIGKMTHSSA